jgi:hypothetical protein
MSPLEVIALVAETFGPTIARALEETVRTERPDLLPPPPARLDREIEDEDDAVIARRFGRK